MYLKRLKNNSQHACLGIKRLAFLTLVRFLWSVQIKTGVSVSSNQWYHSSKASLIVNSSWSIALQFFSAWDKRHEKKAHGWTFLSLEDLWKSTTPTPVSEASTSRMNWHFGVRDTKNGSRREKYFYFTKDRICFRHPFDGPCGRCELRQGWSNAAVVLYEVSVKDE